MALIASIESGCYRVPLAVTSHAVNDLTVHLLAVALDFKRLEAHRVS